MKTLTLILLLFWIPFFSAAVAQDTSPEKLPCSPVSLSGVRVICLSQGVGAFSAKERADGIEQRLRQLAANPTLDPQAMAIEEIGESTNIVHNNHILISIFDSNVDRPELGDRKSMSEYVLAQARSAIEAERALKSPSKLLEGLIYSVTATVILLLILVGMSRLYRRIYTAIGETGGRYIKSLRIQTFELLTSERIISSMLTLARGTRLVLTLLLFYFYIPLILSFFPWTSNWAPKLLSYIITPLQTIARVVIDYIPNLFFILAIAVVTHYLLKFVRMIFLEIENSNLQLQGFYREWANPTYKLIRVLIVAFAFVMTFPYLPGSSSPAFQGISVFLGLLISFGSSSAIANIVAGVVITYMRPFKLGDRVKIADTMGDIVEKNLLVTRIRSIKNVDITIPNSMVLGSHIINYSSTTESLGLILTTTVTMGYDIPWKRVHELLKEAASRTEFIVTEKAPFVLQVALNDFAVAYELNAYTTSPNRMALTYSELHQNIQDCFNEAGIELMSPHFTSIRDGNETTVPPNYRPENYVTPAFQVVEKKPEN